MDRAMEERTMMHHLGAGRSLSNIPQPVWCNTSQFEHMNYPTLIPFNYAPSHMNYPSPIPFNYVPSHMNYPRPIPFNYAPSYYHTHYLPMPQQITHNLHPRVEYVNGRLVTHYSYPEEHTIIVDEDGEITSDFSQLFPEPPQDLIFREEKISRNLTTRTHVPSEESEICVICQAEYEKGETVGSLKCGHEYHVDCIKKWLLQKNVCPICKATAMPKQN